MGTRHIVPSFPSAERPLIGPSFKNEDVSEHHTPSDISSGALARSRPDKSRAMVPLGEEKLAKDLIWALRGIDVELLRPILDIVRRVREQNPRRAEEIVVKISEFFNAAFSGVGRNSKTLPDYLQDLQLELERATKETIN